MFGGEEGGEREGNRGWNYLAINECACEAGEELFGFLVRAGLAWVEANVLVRFEKKGVVVYQRACERGVEMERDGVGSIEQRRWRRRYVIGLMMNLGRK